jgi:hypothetical protein
MPMKKLQLFIVILSFLWIPHALSGVLTEMPAFGSNYMNLNYCLQGASTSVECHMADRVFFYTNCDPNCILYPHIYNDGELEDFRSDIDIDTADSTEGFEMNDRVESLTSSVLIETASSIVRSTALNIFNFPQEVSRLRI